jgi:hypothetical protein
MEYQLLVWLCEQLQTAHLSGAKCIFSGAFAPDYFQPVWDTKEMHCPLHSDGKIVFRKYQVDKTLCIVENTK